MRTTLTLEEDVAKQLRHLCEERGLSFKEAVNEVLRAGFTQLLRTARPARKTYRTPPVSLGSPALPDLDDIGAVLAHAEGEDHR